MDEEGIAEEHRGARPVGIKATRDMFDTTLLEEI